MKESEIQTAIEKVLRIYERSGSCMYIKNNSGAYKTDHGAFVRYGKPGSSDFLLFLKGGDNVFLEVKTLKGRQTDRQKEFQQRVERLGHRYQIVTSAREVWMILEDAKKMG
ncbi:uncharacterized protein METZ01_LOCUS288802 [marine metagenome]|uniref:Uncharacterized protein n=1 Tax=marine metagenome TaxID=408172 RepID=A0A382LGN4_9ZZZZ